MSGRQAAHGGAHPGWQEAIDLLGAQLAELAADEPDAERVAVLVDRLDAVLAGLPAPGAQDGAALAEISRLHAAALDAAKAHRDELAALIARDGQMASGAKAYLRGPAADPRFLDRRG